MDYVLNKFTLSLIIASTFFSQSALCAENSRTLSYLTSWGNYGTDSVAQLDKSKVDTFLLSFGGWDSAGNISSSDNLVTVPTYDAWYMTPAYMAWTNTKLVHPEKKMMVAFGGQTYESMWGYLANDSSREKIAQGLVRLLETGFPVYKKGLKAEEMEGPCQHYKWDNVTCDMSVYQKAGTIYLDGIDFDYEKAARLTPEENENLFKLAARVRQLLGPQSKKLLSLTTYHVGADPISCMNANVTEGCSYVEDKRSSHHGEVLPLLEKGKNTFDFFNVMTYDAGPRFKYEVALANYAKVIGDKTKILLGNTINHQWGPEGSYLESREKNLQRAAWQATNNYGGFFVWALGATSQQLSLADQVQYINEMHQAAKDAKKSQGNQKPKAIAKYPHEITGSGQVILDGSDSIDPENAELSYKWKQTAGPDVTLMNAEKSVASFTLNTTDKDVELKFSLTVNDGELNSDPFEFTIKHKAEQTDEVNQKPTAVALYPHEISGTAEVTLDGTPSSDPEGSALTYKWEQISGPQVTLSAASHLKVRFVPTGINRDAELKFRLTVNDGKLDSDPFEFTIQYKADKSDDLPDTWKSTKVYVDGDVVSWKGSHYKARWWTKGDNPESSDVWENQNKANQQEWDAGKVYNRGDKSLWQDKTWVAKWWTKGDQPGTSAVWESVN